MLLAIYLWALSTLQKQREYDHPSHSFSQAERTCSPANTGHQELYLPDVCRGIHVARPVSSIHKQSNGEQLRNEPQNDLRCERVRKSRINQ